MEIEIVGGEPRRWDLVLTVDGYFGIVSDVAERTVFLANGLDQRMSRFEWASLRRLPLNVKQAGHYQKYGAASFEGLEMVMRN